MGLMEIAIGLVLFLFLALFTLVISPPEALVRKLTSRKGKNGR